MRPARPDEADLVMDLRADAAAWLAEHGSDQWARPWPSDTAMRAGIRASIDRGETWMATTDDDQVLGTIAIDQRTEPGLWTPAEEREPAWYVHRVIVGRAHAGHGLGAAMLRWAAERARAAGARWLRADVWTSNRSLHAYYEGQGWQHVRTIESDYPSGALFQLALAP